MSTSSPSSASASGAPAATGEAGARRSVLLVADPDRVPELASALAEPLPFGAVELLVSSGGDDTIDLFEAHAPRVIVVTASLEIGDAKSLIEAIRDMVARDRVVIVLVGDDDTGPSGSAAAS